MRKTSRMFGQSRGTERRPMHTRHNEPIFVKWKWCFLGDDSIFVVFFFLLSTFSSPPDGRCGWLCLVDSAAQGPAKNVLFTFVLMCFCSNCFRRCSRLRYARNFHLKQERIESNVERQINVYKCFSKRKATKPNTSFICTDWVLAFASFVSGTRKTTMAATAAQTINHFFFAIGNCLGAREYRARQI